MSETTYPRAVFSRYLANLAVFIFLLFGAVALTNMIIDPFDVFGGPEKFGPFKERFSRISSAELMSRENYDIVVLGSSRAQMAIDPEFPEWNGRQVFNAGLPGSNMYEVNRVFHRAIARENPPEIFLLIDFVMFTGATEKQHDFAESLYDPDISPVEYYLQTLFGLHAISASNDVLSRWRGDKQIDFSRKGFRVNTTNAGDPFRQTFDETLRSYLRENHFYGGFTYSPRRVQELRDIVRTARQRQIPITIAIPPIHAEQMEAMLQCGLWNEFERWKRDITQVIEQENSIGSGEPVRIIDFTGYNRITMERVPSTGQRATGMLYWLDSSHASMRTGQLIVRRLNGLDLVERIDSFGVPLESDTLADHLAATRTGRLEWTQRQPASAARVAAISDDVRAERRVPRTGGRPRVRATTIW